MMFNLSRKMFVLRFIFCVFLIVMLHASSLFAVSLSDAVKTVKTMITQGKSRGEIANYVTQVVDNRIISLNRDTSDENELLTSQRYNMYKECFDAWSQEGVDIDEPYAAAHWSWQNEVGHCQENAHTAYHILMMALESGDEIGEFACGDHIYFILGVPKGFTGEITIETLNNWQDAYVIDPWLGVCKPTSEIGRLDLTLTQAGLYSIDRVATWSYATYKRKYDIWLKSCDNFSGKYGTESDKLIVTKVSGKSNVVEGQTMKMMPAGVFQVSQSKNNEVLVIYRASEIAGSAVGRIAVLRDVLKGNIFYANFTKIKIGGKEKLKVVLKTKNPKTNTVIIREGILTKVQ